MNLFGLNLFNQSRDSKGEIAPDDASPGYQPSELAESIDRALTGGTGLFDSLRGGAATPEEAAAFAAAYRAIALISGSMAQLPAYLEDEDGYMVEDPLSIPERSLKPAANIIFGPEMIGGLFYFPDLIKQMTADLAVTGNAVLSKRRFGLRLGSLEYHSPFGMTGTIQRTPDDTAFAAYALSTLGAGFRKDQYPASTLVHPKLTRVEPVNSSSGLLGTSPLKAIKRPIALGNFADRFAKEYFLSGGFGNQGIISFPKQVDGDSAIEIENRIHRRRKKRSMFTVVGGDAKITPLTTDTQTSQMINLKGTLVEDVARAYGVPGSLIGIKTTEVGTGLEELTKIFVRFCLMQYRKSIETAFTYSLFENKYKFKFDVTTFSAADLKALSGFITATQGDAQRLAVMKTLELRSMIDIPKRRADDPPLPRVETDEQDPKETDEQDPKETDDDADPDE